MSDSTADEQAIIDLVVTYAQAIDEGSFEGLRDVFAPDATAALGGSGQAGINEICDRLSSALSPFVGWEHHLSDHQVDIDVDGATATARCSVRAVHVRPPGESPPTYTVVGAYEDQLVRTESGWRITHRSLIVTHREGRRSAG